MGIIFITGINCLVFYISSRLFEQPTGDFNLTLICIVFISIIISSIFLGLFDEAVLATITCVGVDFDLNGDPKFGPPSYHEILKNLVSHSVYEEKQIFTA
jgi:hypothetical protein